MSFIDFLKLLSPRFFQEREVGLDVYLSGIWGWIPAALGVASVTVFFLALFHMVPQRRHSIPVLVGMAILALLTGILGTYFNYAKYPLTGDGPVPDIFTRGGGRIPITDSHKATLLAFPLLLGIAVAVESIFWSVFLLLFGGKDKERSEEKKGKDNPRSQ